MKLGVTCPIQSDVSSVPLAGLLLGPLLVMLLTSSRVAACSNGAAVLQQISSLTYSGPPRVHVM